MIQILEEAKKFNEDQREHIYIAYIRRADADPAIMAQILEETKNNLTAKLQLYHFYLKRPNADNALIEKYNMRQ